MSAHHYHEPFAEALAGPEELPEEGEDRLRCLIRELLIKNQQLRMLLESAKAAVRRDQDDWNLQMG